MDLFITESEWVTLEDCLRRPKRHLGPGVSVELDWFGELAETHLAVFRTSSEELESSFGMFGISLNEAVTLYRDGLLALSFEEAVLVSDMCRRFCQNLDNTLRSLGEHSQAYGTAPSVESLNPSDFESRYGLHSALASSLWNLAVYSQPRRFLNKVRTLGAMANHIGNDVCASGDLLGSQGASIDSAPHWLTMTEGHWDLNACFREASVLLKCFLRVLPDDQLSEFRDNIFERKTRTARPK
jgi:hypothetical protein